MALWGKNTNIDGTQPQIVLFTKDHIKKEEPEVDYTSTIEEDTNRCMGEDPISLYNNGNSFNEGKLEIATLYIKEENQIVQKPYIPDAPSKSDLYLNECTDGFFNKTEDNEVKPFLNMENREKLEELLHEEIHIKDENETWNEYEYNTKKRARKGKVAQKQTAGDDTKQLFNRDQHLLGLVPRSSKKANSNAHVVVTNEGKDEKSTVIPEQRPEVSRKRAMQPSTSISRRKKHRAAWPTTAAERATAAYAEAMQSRNAALSNTASAINELASAIRGMAAAVQTVADSYYIK